ncbi:hypothetical protein K5549_001456 [Capra hircus]|nr:hypothetical protein K5549_001456 [Capra hircus]
MRGPVKRELKQALQVFSGYDSGSAVKKTDNSTLFIVEVKANKHHIKQAVKKLCDTDAAKANTLIRPVGEKKACVQLAPGCEALDIANKIGII